MKKSLSLIKEKKKNKGDKNPSNKKRLVQNSIALVFFCLCFFVFCAFPVKKNCFSSVNFKKRKIKRWSLLLRSGKKERSHSGEKKRKRERKRNNPFLPLLSLHHPQQFLARYRTYKGKYKTVFGEPLHRQKKDSFFAKHRICFPLRIDPASEKTSG